MASEFVEMFSDARLPQTDDRQTTLWRNL